MKKTSDPVSILRSLLNRVAARRKESASPEQQSALDQAQSAGGELLPDYKGKDVYISFDGDNIGNAVARAESKDDEAELSSISEKIKAGQDLFAQFLVQHQGRLVEAGGDEGLGRCNSNCLVDIEEFRQKYKELVGATVTVGVGERISQATKARMLGKLRGKNQVCHYDESTDNELQIRTEQGGHEAEKLGQAGLLPQKSKEDQEVPKFGISPDQGQGKESWQQEYDEPESSPEPESATQDSDQEDSSEEQGPDQEPEEEYYDYSDLPFEEKRDISHRKLADQIGREEGADPRFLHLATRNLFRR